DRERHTEKETVREGETDRDREGAETQREKETDRKRDGEIDGGGKRDRKRQRQRQRWGRRGKKTDISTQL
ncbi:hypothetical protein, partial [Streptococcus anginosus]|uniref:hypothetical protein n=1 Tax=Streptococcus anginosus TaxID=1328 RepID=UPI002EDADDAB